MRRLHPHPALLLLLATGCSVESMPADDGGVLADAQVSDGGPTFDPGTTYPGEGNACEFSLFCQDLQICVDGECQRYERFEPEDLEITELRQIPPADLETSWLIQAEPAGWATRDPGPITLSAMNPTAHGPALLVWPFEREGCRVAVVGGEESRVVATDRLICLAAAMSPEGHILVGGLHVTTFLTLEPTYGFVLFGRSGAVLAEVDYPADIVAQVDPTGSVPDAAAFGPTSILWDADRFLFSGSFAAPGRGSAVGAPRFASHAFYGAVSLAGELTVGPFETAPLQEGSFGWLVRDAEGVRSILTRYMEPFDRTTTTQVELLDLSGGDREVLVRGEEGLARNGRFFQPERSVWAGSFQDYPDSCSASLFLNGQLQGEVMDGACSSQAAPSGEYGSSDVGAIYTGNRQHPWVEFRVDTIVDGETESYEAVLFAPEVGEWLRAPLTLPVDGPDGLPTASFQGVSRYGRTLEILPLSLGNQLMVLEGRLTRSPR